MNVTVDLINASGNQEVPTPEEFQRWSTATMDVLGAAPGHMELSIRLVNSHESAELNKHYRHKTGATNILSFPATRFAGLPEDAPVLLGDLAICTQVVLREAGEQGKTAQAHFAHLTVHGVLHLNGHDHEAPEEASTMEALEVETLGRLGFPNPYE